MTRPAIEKLDIPTRVKLRSSQILTSLPQIVSELVQNSLDAGATTVDIGVNCEEWMCWVKDNGSGIQKQGLVLLASGIEDGRYGSSKPYEPDTLNSLSTFGFRGEALASAADLSCLEISSRTAKSRETWSVITKGGKNLFSGPAIRWRRESPGTVVCIRDAFYNLPVRRRSHLPPARTFELVRQELETYALIFTHVTFTLENTCNDPGSSKGHLLRIPKTTSSLASFRNLYGRALTEHVEPIDVQSGSLRLDGFISLNGAHSRTYQFLYVNRHPVARCDLHHIIDSAFASSSFGKNALDENGEIDLPRSTTRRSPRKIERRPVYVLNLTIPSEQVDNCLEPSKNQIQLQHKDVVVEVLSSAVNSFLSHHGFIIPDQVKSQRSIGTRVSSSPRKRRKTNLHDDCSYAEGIEPGEPPLDVEHDKNIEVRPLPQLVTVNAGNEDTTEVVWNDPNTGQCFTVDLRTGNSHAQFDCLPDDDHTLSNQERRRTIPCKDPMPAKPTDLAAPEWLRQALQANTTYSTAENSILKVKPSSLRPQHGHPFQGATHSHRLDPSQQFHPDLGLDNHRRRFERQDLYGAKVISQVDKKFIACLIDHQHNRDEELQDWCGPNVEDRRPVLVLIDQHAADERVRVERLLKDLCLGFLRNREKPEMMDGIKLRELSPLRPLLLTIHEARKLKESVEVQQAFHHWGFEFNFTNEPLPPTPTSGDVDTSSYTQVFVRSIPDIVGDKLLLGDELRDLTKGYLGKLEVEMPSNLNMVRAEETDDMIWLKALRWCPRELLNLVNSKACRGAIMFNDTLSLSQCEDLVEKLSGTTFPFQCAHGRPSLVPLTSIGRFSKRNKIAAVEWSRLEQSI